MSDQPAVSVVMGVYNGAARLRETLDSILAQRDVAFEVVVVDDGSTDGTAAILDATKGLRVIRQQNEGLTRSLITGCRAARAPFIARHDCGDRSHPDRLRKQLDLMTSAGDIVVVSCATQYVGPEGEKLYVVSSEGADVQRSLLHDGVDAIRGLTHHGTAMFRRDVYFDAGEYRPEFRFAQDLDLWLRMAQRGRIAFVPEVLYEARFEANAISGLHREQQVESARIAIALRDAPAADQAALLRRASEISPARKAGDRSKADGLYFLAMALKKSAHGRWRRYAWEAVRNNPLHFRAWG
ncbi:MAG TPA: glycosyltransferase family 2 protein, partial [Thermoanaerobaculia bacterium]|nr:glycosyltransferase family 2 protein [Thermoanaerobaculia bacterium]